MPVRLRERRSALADWAQRIAILSVPILIIAGFGHRAGMMAATPTYAVMALGFTLAAMAVIAALAAFEGIWRDGRKGLGPALRGFLLGLAVLVLPAVGAWKLISHPRLTDISTDLDNPPEFVLALADRPPDSAPLSAPDAQEAELQREAYPDIVPRHYPVGTARVFEDAAALAQRSGWRILGATAPGEPANVGRIEAVDATPIFGFREDIVIRIVPDGEGALVDMRSAARSGAHDLGSNAARIRDFFRELDASLQGITEE
jgi:hypothetical protein